jgi:hypothetical protein
MASQIWRGVFSSRCHLAENDQAETQGCQIVYFCTKNPNAGIFWRTLEWKMLEYLMTIWNIKRPLRIF